MTPREATFDPATYDPKINSNSGRRRIRDIGWYIFNLPGRLLDGTINYISSMIKLP